MDSRPLLRLWIAAPALLASVPVAARAQVLYDGALNTAPGDQGWFAFTVGATETVSGGATTLDTQALNAVQAGYSRTDTTLDRNGGFSLRFTVRLLAESHANPDRAGFSLICLTSDAKGIELGFWSDRVFAQSDSPSLFVHAEEGFLDTTAARTPYTLDVQGSAYTLRAHGAVVLSGALRDYTGFAGFPDPYETPNFLFLGDDTTSARGAFQLSRVAVTAPEPGTLALAAAGLALRNLRRRRR